MESDGLIAFIRSSNFAGIRILEDIADPARGFQYHIYGCFEVGCTNAIRVLCYDKIEPPGLAKPIKERSRLSRP